MNTKFIVIILSIFLTMLGAKWGYDAYLNRKIAEGDCFAKMSAAEHASSEMIVLCGKIWGEKNIRAAFDHMKKERERNEKNKR